MFTIEHDFDATIITLVDEGDDGQPLLEDIAIAAFAECVTLTQYDARNDREQVVTLSMAQLRDLAAALNMAEGVYRLER